jgi:hypothetical protein
MIVIVLSAAYPAGDEIWIYVFGTARRHEQAIPGTGQFRRFTLRLDGWASLRASFTPCTGDIRP